MKIGKVIPTKIGAACLFVNGIILLFYALFVPTFARGVHWLIFLAAILFILAVPAIYHSIRRLNRIAALVVAALFGVAMIAIIASDLLFVSSFLTALSRELTYALGNALFLIGVLTIGFVTFKGGFYKWVAYLSIITGLVGLASYIPQASGLLATLSLSLLGLWSLAVGFNIRKLSK
jgi:hypothetical protein